MKQSNSLSLYTFLMLLCGIGSLTTQRVTMNKLYKSRRSYVHSSVQHAKPM